LLPAGEFRVQTPVGERDFLLVTPIQTGPGAHLISCAMGTVSPFQQQNGQGLALTTPPPFSITVKVGYCPTVPAMARYGEAFIQYISYIYIYIYIYILNDIHFITV
jgi:hypothetical protein